MRAMICSQWGGPEDLRLEEVESPPRESGQVRIRIRAAGVSFATTLVIAGKYQRRPPFPFAAKRDKLIAQHQIDGQLGKLLNIDRGRLFGRQQINER